jgi:CelD/BcsL family acetyltransferase involved in cellulose biosynthesis
MPVVTTSTLPAAANFEASPLPAAPSIAEHRELNHLDGLFAPWAALLERTPDAQPFGHPGWLRAYWRHFGERKTLRLLTISEGADLTGVLPLVVRGEPTRVGSLRTLTFPLDQWGAWYGPIGPRPGSILRQGLDHIAHTPRDWDLLDLRWLANPDDALAALAAAGLPGVASVLDRTALVELPDGWDAYWKSRSSHWRTNVRRSIKKTAEAGALAFERHRPLGQAANDADPRWDLYDACEALAKSSWQGASTTGTTMSHATIREFLRDAHLAAAEAGTLDVALLRVAGRPVAFCYNYHLDGYVFGLRSGFDAALGAAGAGSALMHFMLEDSCRRGDRVLDLGPDYFEAKRNWHTRRADIFRVTHYSRRSPRAQLLRALHAWRAAGR